MKAIIDNKEVDIPDDVIDSAVKARMEDTAEKWLKNLLSAEFTARFHKDGISFCSGGQFLFFFDFRNKNLWVDEIYCWSVLYNKFDLDYYRVKALYQKVLLKPLGLHELTPLSVRLAVGHFVNVPFVGWIKHESISGPDSSAEKYLADFLLNGLCAKFDPYHITFYKNDIVWAFQLSPHQSALYCHSKHFWEHYCDKFGMTHEGCQVLYKKVLLDPLGLGDYCATGWNSPDTSVREYLAENK